MDGNNLKRYLFYFIPLLVFISGLTIRLVGLGTNPPGLTNDEANIGYDVYSILKTGKDQWGEKQPAAYLKGFGDFRPPVYTYLVVPSVYLFGLNEYAVRFPSAILGSLTLIPVFLLSYLLFKNYCLSLIAMTLLTLNPWHIAMSRVGIESTAAVFFVSLALVFLLLSGRKKFLYYFSVIFFAVSVYTYTSNLVISPILLTVAVILFRKKLNISSQEILGGAVIFTICMLPMGIGSAFKTANARTGQVSFTNDVGIINNVNDKRGECILSYNPKLCQIADNKYSAYAMKFLDNYFNHFSPLFMAFKGTNTQYSVMQETGLLYVIEYLAFIAGIYFLTIKRKNENIMILFWVLLSPVPDSVTGGGHYSRFLAILPAVQIAAAYGLTEIFKKITRYRVVYLVSIIFLLGYESVLFSVNYWSFFPRFYANYSHYGYKNLMEYIYQFRDNYDKIIVSNRVNDTKQYVYYLFYTKYDPAEFIGSESVQKTAEGGGWIRVRKIDNIYFLSNITITDEMMPESKTPKILFAGAPSEFPPKTKPIYVINDLKKNINFMLVDTEQNRSMLPQKYLKRSD